uniref:Apolipoprotein B n=1 Tax=Panagrolaimus sp. JU765 TaxID=591449 RepID=A0AC34QSN3_9BILA
LTATSCYRLRDVKSIPIFGSDVENIYKSKIRTDVKTGIATLVVTEDRQVLFKIEKDDAQRSLICSNVTPDEWKDDRPRFFFGKDHVAVEYFKNGILWKLKDASGNDKIPFKISFDKEIHVGAAALEHPEFLMSDLDLEILANANIKNKTAKISPPFFKDADSDLKIMLKTANGPQKTAPKNILAIFVKSIVKLLEEELENPVKEIYLNFDFPHELSKNSPFSFAFNFLKIDFELQICQ